MLSPETVIVIYIYTVTIMESKADPFFASDFMIMCTAVPKIHTVRYFLRNEEDI